LISSHIIFNEGGVEMGEPTLSSGGTRGKPQHVRVSTGTLYIRLLSDSPQRVRVSTGTEDTIVNYLLYIKECLSPEYQINLRND